MKVVAPGLFAFAGTTGVLTGWHFDAEGESFPDEDEQNRAVLVCAFRFMALVNGVQLRETRLEEQQLDRLDGAINLAAERDTRNIIDNARRRQP